ncbi:AmmeMemoRadiSam system radical SAM enzyme [Anoxynatronum sibiricum]|uniref:AmmeMemoRadiSam system radical SAM enzyme n=1 Tax=Anoxynatronum sibiricum TaxID=210623 RepID=A0ABU9VY34_9CLOT
MKPADFSRFISGDVMCMLCPHHCRLALGETGICRVRRHEPEGLVSLSYGKISSVQIDPIEKKPLARFMSGTETYSIGSYGCQLRCPYCQNYHLAMEIPKLWKITPQTIIEQALQAGTPSISYTYNEPLINYEFVIETATLAKDAGLYNILVTNGYIDPEPLKTLLPTIDAMNIDIKSFRDRTYRKMCGGSLKPVLETVKTANKSCHVEVTTLLVTNMHTMEEMEELVDWIAHISADIPLHVSRYFPRYRWHEPPTNLNWVYEIVEMAKRKLTHVYAGNC